MVVTPCTLPNGRNAYLATQQFPRFYVSVIGNTHAEAIANAFTSILKPA